MSGKQIADGIAGEGMGYVGNITFKPCNVVPETTYEGWMKEAEIEFLLSREAAVILNFDDKALSKHLRRCGETEEEQLHRLCDMVETFKSWGDRFAAGQDVTKTVVARLLVIAERWLGRDVMERCNSDGEDKTTIN